LIDFPSRHLVRCGELERLVADDAVVGVTSNPTIFQKAISAEHDYDEQLRRELAETEDPHEAFLRLAERDIRGACDVLRPVFDRGGTPHDGEATGIAMASSRSR
jgi:transaldolase